VGASWGLPPAQRLVKRILSLRDAPVHAPAATTRPAEARPAEASVPSVPEHVLPDVAPPTAGARTLRRASAGRVGASTRVAAAQSAAPAEDPVVAESRLLAEALAALRQGRDPQHALRTLDQYDQRFPTGSLSPEAAAARIDALLALGRKGQALARLEALSFERLPRAAEMQVLRGELRAGRGNLTGAVDDFESALSWPGAPAAVIERALYGRSSCRSRMGDQAGARTDLQEYMRRFPRGRFAAPAGHALGE
jgi:tetratricopeptide (TPR) repeat protein